MGKKDSNSYWEIDEKFWNSLTSRNKFDVIVKGARLDD
jgi:hypothetical protein